VRAPPCHPPRHPRAQYNVFLFMILGFALLTLIYLSIFPSDRDHLNKASGAHCEMGRGARGSAW
jgi:hypothetical protein